MTANLLRPKRRLLPLAIVSAIFFVALMYALLLNPRAISLVFAIFVPLVAAVLLLTAWLSRRQLGSLYLMMNNAYLRYQEYVLTGKSSYEQFCQNFLDENEPTKQNYRYRKVQREYEDAINRNLIHTLLTNDKETVEQAFAPVYKDHELPMDVFRNLCERTKAMNAPKPKTEKETVKFKPCLTDEDLSTLADCINEAEIIKSHDGKELTPDDLRRFFLCETEPGKELVLCQNKSLAYLMMRLSDERFISRQWQAAIDQNHLLVSEKTKNFINRNSLAQAKKQLDEGNPKSEDTIEKHIAILKVRPHKLL